MPKAPFLTEGRMTRHSALSRRSWGMLSGIFRISLRTVPASLTRSSSRSSFSAANARAANALNVDTRRTRAAMSFFMHASRKNCKEKLSSLQVAEQPRTRLNNVLQTIHGAVHNCKKMHVLCHDQTCAPFVTWHWCGTLLESMG